MENLRAFAWVASRELEGQLTNKVEHEERRERRLRMFQALVDWSPVVPLIVKAVTWLVENVG
ncbi:hypothetical protein OG280_41255 (plasmid) [Streptomyces virginiae]|uniref:hypothetical protein n=1 Tax=Streptomyces virginiae TaxID=1961 RepID=UPI002DD7BABD|nr:hypothetical protein [Streptomyces virginiae]WSC82782.1 hypothetical protein OHA56_41005 [Streptomyces virginiae]